MSVFNSSSHNIMDSTQISLFILMLFPSTPSLRRVVSPPWFSLSCESYMYPVWWKLLGLCVLNVNTVNNYYYLYKISRKLPFNCVFKNMYGEAAFWLLI